MKDEREILTRQIVYKKMMTKAKSSVIGALIFFFFEALAFGMQIWLVAMASSMSTAVVILEGLLAAALVGHFVFLCMRGVIRMGKVQREEFIVVEDRLEDMQEERPNILRMLMTGRISNLSNYDHVFRFESGRKLVVNCGEVQNSRMDAVAKFSLPGDVFYLVCFRDSSEKIVLLFATKIYQYKDTLDQTLPK